MAHIPHNATQTEHKDLRKALSAYLEYLELSRLLFGSDDIYDITDLPETSKFYKPAMDIAVQLGVGWKDMTHSESNRIMLALLEDYYNNMAMVADSKDLSVQVKIISNEQRQKKPAERDCR